MAPKSEFDVEGSNVPQIAEEVQDEQPTVMHLYASNEEEMDNLMNPERTIKVFEDALPYENFLAFARDCKQKGYVRVIHSASIYYKDQLSEQIVERVQHFESKFRDEGMTWLSEVVPQATYGSNDKIWIEGTDGLIVLHSYFEGEDATEMCRYNSAIATHVFVSNSNDEHIAGCYRCDGVCLENNTEVVVTSIPFGGQTLMRTDTRCIHKLLTLQESIGLFGQQLVEEHINEISQSEGPSRCDFVDENAETDRPSETNE